MAAASVFASEWAHGSQLLPSLVVGPMCYYYVLNSQGKGQEFCENTGDPDECLYIKVIVEKGRHASVIGLDQEREPCLTQVSQA